MKQFSYSRLLLALSLAVPGMASAVAVNDDGKFHSSSWASCADAINDLNNTNYPTTLVVDTTCQVSTTTSINADVSLEFAGFGLIEVSGNSELTINGPINAPLRQIFNPLGNSTVKFGDGYNQNVFLDMRGRNVAKVYPQWWGAKADWTNDGQSNDTNNSYAINAALNSGARHVELTGGAYYIGNVTLVIPQQVGLFNGSGKDQTRIAYDGSSGAAVQFVGASAEMSDLTVETLSNDAMGIYFSDAARKSSLTNVNVTSISVTPEQNTGEGILLDGNNGWIGGIDLNNITVSRYKYGIKTIGNSGAGGNNTVTTVVGKNVWLVGYVTGQDGSGNNTYVTGSAGIYTDEFSNGVGNTIVGGTIEGFDTALEFTEGATDGFGRGFSYVGDIENNKVNWQVGNTFIGEIYELSNGSFIKQSANGKQNLWAKDEQKIGASHQSYDYYSRFFDFNVNWEQRKFGARDDKDQADLGGFSFAEFSNGTQVPQNNYIYFREHKLLWYPSAPTTGTWTTGDRVFNSQPAVGQPKGWICVQSGTPGTWVSEGNL